MEGLFRRPKGYEIRKEVEDVMVWWLAKEGTFLIKSFYFSLSGCHSKGFPHKSGLEPLGAGKSRLLCLGSSLGFFFYFGSAKKRGVGILVIDVILCKVEEDLVNQILLRCP